MNIKTFSSCVSSPTLWRSPVFWHLRSVPWEEVQSLFSINQTIHVYLRGSTVPSSFLGRVSLVYCFVLSTWEAPEFLLWFKRTFLKVSLVSSPCIIHLASNDWARPFSQVPVGGGMGGDHLSSDILKCVRNRSSPRHPLPWPLPCLHMQLPAIQHSSASTYLELDSFSQVGAWARGWLEERLQSLKNVSLQPPALPLHSSASWGSCQGLNTSPASCCSDTPIPSFIKNVPAM